MTRRTAGLVAWSVFAVSSATNVAGIVVLAFVPDSALAALGDSLWLSGSFSVVLVVFGLVGAIVSSRLPSNPVGWLLLVLASLQGATELAYATAHYSISVSSLPGEAWSAWFSGWSSVVPPVVLAVLMMVYPDGRLVSPRWRWAAAACVAFILPVVLQGMLAPGPLYEFPAVANPAGIGVLHWLDDVPTEPAFLVVLGLGTASVVVRFRRSHGVERTQLKWFAWAAALMTIFLPLAFLATRMLGPAGPARADALGGFLFALLLCGLPVSIGIAILRHRLYDIDRLINRTLVYGTLTALLVATYVVSVLLLRVALDPLVGGSDLAVAGSTLAAAAMFRPLRTRIQRVVDRRFYRSGYDAARTLDGFTLRLRHELDLETLGTDLRGVVHDTMQPAHVSLWMRVAPAMTEVRRNDSGTTAD